MLRSRREPDPFDDAELYAVPTPGLERLVPGGVVPRESTVLVPAGTEFIPAPQADAPKPKARKGRRT